MSKTDLAVVLCRLVGLYFMLNSIYGLSSSAISLCSSLLFGGMLKFTTQLLLNLALPQLVGLLVGLVVWRKALAIGQKMAAFEAIESHQIPFDTRNEAETKQKPADGQSTRIEV